ncbi:hypothetical protein Hypma_002600 [Hypsizygus marmoreus]|uniref:Uncharacterized protein n=1 Tax=Hypsizygus marmoreus TaxID=39966 RepID=A0A369J844_HYPMA|nr:hypothetical protein Hypma_002600 [Hypsizygus marmoreus]
MPASRASPMLDSQPSSALDTFGFTVDHIRLTKFHVFYVLSLVALISAMCRWLGFCIDTSPTGYSGINGNLPEPCPSQAPDVFLTFAERTRRGGLRTLLIDQVGVVMYRLSMHGLARL